MKKIYCLMTLMLATPLWAGPWHDDKNSLNLTAEQQEKMKAVKQATNEKLEAAHKEILAESKAQMAEFLTAEQMAQLENIQAHRQEHAQLRKNHKKMKRKRPREHRNDG